LVRPTGKRALLAGALLFLLGFAGATLARGPQTAHVKYALDGDSLVLATGQQVRLIGVNAPEMSNRAQAGGSSADSAPQPLAREARALASKLTEGRQVSLVYESERNDHYGRELAHVLLADGHSLEEELLKQGLAWAVALPPNVDWVKRLTAAESEARNARRGVWAEPAYVPIAADRLTTHDTGFRLVTGELRSLRETARALYFELAPGVTVLIPRDSWRLYFSGYGAPGQIVGRRVTARGWVTAHGGNLRLRVAHPAMLTLSN
jgi:micrococcal nuclease